MLPLWASTGDGLPVAESLGRSPRLRTGWMRLATSGRATGEHHLETLAVAPLDADERPVGHDAERHHAQAERHAAPEDEDRTGQQVRPVHELGAPGLEHEPAETGV